MKNLLPVGYTHTGTQQERVPEQAEIGHSIGEFMFFTCFFDESHEKPIRARSGAYGDPTKEGP